MKYDDLKAKADAATPGPWRHVGPRILADWSPLARAMLYPDSEVRERNAAYIAAANPVAIKALIADYAKLRMALETVRDDFDHDEDAHKYGTPCRECLAREILKETE